MMAWATALDEAGDRPGAPRRAAPAASSATSRPTTSSRPCAQAAAGRRRAAVPVRPRRARAAATRLPLSPASRGLQAPRSATQSPDLPPCFSSTRMLAHHHAAVGRLAHVVDGEQADLHGGQRLHLDAGAAERLDLRGAVHAVRGGVDLELHRHARDRQRVAQRDQSAGALGRLDGGDARHADHVALLRRAAPGSAPAWPAACGSCRWRARRGASRPWPTRRPCGPGRGRRNASEVMSS